jgi:hypothetical protein
MLLLKSESDPKAGQTPAPLPSHKRHTISTLPGRPSPSKSLFHKQFDKLACVSSVTSQPFIVCRIIHRRGLQLLIRFSLRPAHSTKTARMHDQHHR